MNWRLYLTGLIIALAFFGISLEQSTLPNQEIVVQFNADSINTDDTQHAITSITNQLKAIGVAEVKVSEIQNGKLKVTYYSTIDVAVIKGLFEKQEKLHLDYTTFNENENSSKIPFGSDSNPYKLDVIKIQHDYGSNMGLHGLLVEVKSARDQYLNPIVFLGTAIIDFSLRRSIERVTCVNYQDAVILIDNSSHKIPEVRAGPLA